jgi:hypothetical protein
VCNGVQNISLFAIKIGGDFSINRGKVWQASENNLHRLGHKELINIIASGGNKIFSARVYLSNGHRRAYCITTGNAVISFILDIYFLINLTKKAPFLPERG